VGPHALNPPPLGARPGRLDTGIQYTYVVVMQSLRFEWDARKDRRNQREHGVSFAEAQTVFFDEDAVEFYDDEHSEWEDRFLLLGCSAKARVLLVCHCLRQEGAVIRIISARRATKAEQRLYPQGEP
jgi:uncharacterized protein